MTIFKDKLDLYLMVMTKNALFHVIILHANFYRQETLLDHDQENDKKETML